MLIQDIVVYGGLICMFAEMFYSGIRRRTETEYENVVRSNSQRENNSHNEVENQQEIDIQD